MNNSILSDELVLQNSVIPFHNCLRSRIQIMEKSVKVTLDLDTNAYSYPDGILNMAKPGIRVHSTIKQTPKKRIKKQFVFEGRLEKPEDFKNMVLTRSDRYCEIEVTIRLYDIARADVKEAMRRYFDSIEDDLK